MSALHGADRLIQQREEDTDALKSSYDLRIEGLTRFRGILEKEKQEVRRLFCSSLCVARRVTLLSLHAHAGD